MRLPKIDKSDFEKNKFQNFKKEAELWLGEMDEAKTKRST
jgi:hypothetical protein